MSWPCPPRAPHCGDGVAGSGLCVGLCVMATGSDPDRNLSMPIVDRVCKSGVEGPHRAGRGIGTPWTPSGRRRRPDAGTSRVWRRWRRPSAPARPLRPPSLVVGIEGEWVAHIGAPGLPRNPPTRTLSCVLFVHPGPSSGNHDPLHSTTTIPHPRAPSALVFDDFFMLAQNR